MKNKKIKIVSFSFLACMAFTLVLIADTSSAKKKNKSVEFPEKHYKFIDRYCLSCHDSDTEKGKVNLEEISYTIKTNQQAESWQKVLDVLNSGEMPPEKKKQPKDQEKVVFLDELSKTMVKARNLLSDSGGKITMRRLNRREYSNTIQDLLGVDIDVSLLPDDKTTHGFDTYGSGLFMSADQLGYYQTIAKNALEEAMVKASYKTNQKKTVRIQAETAIAKEKKAYQKVIKDHVSFLKYKKLVDKAADMPENEEFMEAFYKKHKKPKNGNHIRLYYESNQLKNGPNPKKYGFKDAFKTGFHYSRYMSFHASSKHYYSLPKLKDGIYLKVRNHNGNAVRNLYRPKNLKGGIYKLKLRTAVVDDMPEDRRFIELAHLYTVPGSQQKDKISTHEVSGTMENPETQEIVFEIPANAQYNGLRVSDRLTSIGDSIKRKWSIAKKKNGRGIDPAIWIDWIEWEGPFRNKQEALGTTNVSKSNQKSNAHQSRIIRVQPEKFYNTWQNKRFEEWKQAHKKYLAWKEKVDIATKDPLNAEVVKKYFEGIPKNNKSKLINTVDILANQLKGAPNPKDYGFEDAFFAKTHISRYTTFFKLHDYIHKLPHRDTGSYLKVFVMTAESHSQITVSPHKVTKAKVGKTFLPGNYIFRMRVAAVDDAPKQRRFVEIGHMKKNKKEGDMSIHQITGTMKKPQILEVPFKIPHNLDYIHTRVKDRITTLNKGLMPAFWQHKAKNGRGIDPAIWIDWLEIEGPFESKTGSTISFSDILKSNDNNQIFDYIFDFATHAFRSSKPSKDYLESLKNIYLKLKKEKKSTKDSLKEVLSIILSSPEFIYISEQGDDSKKLVLSQRELAVRLSYFLWSSPPDDTLLDLANKGELTKPHVLEKQIDRLLSHDKSMNFIKGFMHQWLHMDRLNFFQFNNQKYPDFDNATKEAARQEVFESFAHILKNNYSLSKLLKSDYILTNGILATFYGIDGVSGTKFEKVNLPKGSPRGGLLGMAAIMAMGSDGEESSPVERGAWVLRKLLNDPPPPAPANIPQLSRLNDKNLTTKQKVILHQEKPQCASCHRKIDPIGFGLENFNAVGKWRASYASLMNKKQKGKKSKKKGSQTKYKIDASGKLFKGESFSDYFKLRDIIASKEGQFSRGFTEALISYALGRPFGFSDQNFADTMLNEIKNEDYKTRSFIYYLVKSELFQRK